jgi:hypothetical protein
LPSPVVPPPWVAPPDSDGIVDPSIWQEAPGPREPAAGEIVLEAGEAEAFMGEAAPSETCAEQAAPDFAAGWAAIRDANIRPYVEWVVPPPLSLPVAASARGGGGRPPLSGQNPTGQNPNGRGGNDSGGGRRQRRRSRHVRNRHGRDGGDRRGPRLPGVYNPGGD